MKTLIKEKEQELAKAAAGIAIEIINRAIAEKGMAAIILATGTSQTELLKELTGTTTVDWKKVVVFHLDEYIGIPADHPASFRRYLNEHFLSKAGPVKAFHLVAGDAPDPAEECKRISSLIAGHTIDLALVGIGENGHLAFNDPPADFDTESPYIVVGLEERCRQQQVNEGHFPSVETVPEKAISMSVRQIMKSACIICFVPDRRKAKAVRDCLEEEVSKWYPAGILRQHGCCYLFLDTESASLLKAGTRRELASEYTT